MTDHISTGYVLELYGIKRQNLDNWIRDGLLDEPEKDSRGWRVWTADSLMRVRELTAQKSRQDARAVKELAERFDISSRRYLGSKQKLIEFIDAVVKENIHDFNTFFEPFAGTGAVSNHFNNLGKAVIVNDILKSNQTIYDAFFGSGPYNIKKISDITNRLNKMQARNDNYFSRNYGGKYFTMENARMIGAVRDKICVLHKRGKINSRENNILVTSLIYAADRVANTCGHYDAYRGKLDTTKKLALQIPRINDEANRDNKVFCMDANALARVIRADVTYIDTPYNSRQYSDSYHLLENLAENSKPELFGKACKMNDRKGIKSRYCTGKAAEAFRDLIENLSSDHILVSYNNMAQKGDKRSNAKISGDEIMEILAKKGPVKVYETDFSAFSAGRSQIDGHKEIIYYCRCLNPAVCSP